MIKSPLTQMGLTWQRLLFWALAGVAGAFALLMAGFRFFDPFLAVFVVVFAIAAFLVRRGGRGPVIFALVIAIVFFAMNVPFLVPTLMQPSSIPDFVPAVLVLIFDVIAIVAAINILRRRGTGAGPRTAARIGGALFVIAVVVSVVATVTFNDAVAQAGDIRLVTQDTAFQDGSLEAESGTVGVFVENKDQTLHTFTIDELDVDLQIPAGSSVRVEFAGEPGEYRFYCVPHQDVMEGTLTIR